MSLKKSLISAIILTITLILTNFMVLVPLASANQNTDQNIEGGILQVGELLEISKNEGCLKSVSTILDEIEEDSPAKTPQTPECYLIFRKQPFYCYKNPSVSQDSKCYTQRPGKLQLGHTGHEVFYIPIDF